MISLDYEVIIASEGAQATLLKQEFPALKCVYLRGYRLSYAGSGLTTTLKILTQMPKILISIKRENRWLATFLSRNHVDLVISDNRYGLFSRGTSSIFITHQLNIRSFFKAAGESLLRKMNYYFIERFSECWVPDYKGAINLAGALSHPARLPSIPVAYIGPLTRLHPTDTVQTKRLLILLSGPEPQRTILETILLQQLREYHEPVVMIRGLPGVRQELPSFNQVTFYNHLRSQEINEMVNAAGIIISRSGYSTVMDMMALQKKCVFIPTPGQTEQLYLAKYLALQSHCLFYPQHAFSLNKALEQMRAATLVPFVTHGREEYKTVLTAHFH